MHHERFFPCKQTVDVADQLQLHTLYGVHETPEENIRNVTQLEPGRGLDVF